MMNKVGVLMEAATLLDVFEDLVKNGGDDIKKVLLTKRKRLGAKKHRPVKKILEELEKELSVKCREKLKITSTTLPT